MIRTAFALLMTSLLLAPAASAQGLTFDKEALQTHTRDIVNAAGRSYRLVITLPSGYDSTKTSKVLYYVDAWWLADLVIGAYRIKSLSTSMDDVILVGISSIGNEREWHRQRGLDLTPTPYSVKKMLVRMSPGDIPMNDSTTGGADAFVEFLRTRVITTIERDYRIEAASRGFLGHSFGGLFGFHLLRNHPDLFANYILLSPAVWWNQSEPLEGFDTAELSRRARVFMVMGSAEAQLLKGPVQSVADLMQSTHAASIDLRYNVVDGANHNSVLPQGIYDGIEWMYQRK